jgi:type IV secretory pathway VirB4 component
VTVLRRTERPGHRATTRLVQAAYPFMAEGGLGGRGVHIGTDANGGAFVYDPWELYGTWLTNPNMLVGGQIGKGKSSFVKTYIYRQAVFPRLAWILDPKGEYGRLAHALGCDPIRLEPNGAVRLNPLTPRAGWTEQVRLLKAVATAELRRPLSPAESGALREALRIVQTTTDEPTLPKIAGLLLRPIAELADPLATDVATIAEDVRDVALALQDLCEGELAGMFDGPTSPGLDFAARCVVLDLSAMYNSEAIGILMICAAAFQRAVINDLRDRAEAGEQNTRKIISVYDECWKVIGQIGVGEWLQESFKLSRSHGTQNIIVIHRLSDLQAAGAAGSRERALAEGLLADAETRVMYGQSTDQLDWTRDTLRLTGTETELLPALDRGVALWKVGQRSFIVRHRRSRAEEPLSNTDARMAVSGEGRAW